MLPATGRAVVVIQQCSGKACRCWPFSSSARTDYLFAAGLATGLVIALFPFAAVGGGLLAVSSATGAILGAVAGHAAAGMGRDDLKELGESLDSGEAGLVVVGVMDLEARIEESMRHAEKLQKKLLEADVEALERDAKDAVAQ